MKKGGWPLNKLPAFFCYDVMASTDEEVTNLELGANAVGPGVDHGGGEVPVDVRVPQQHRVRLLRRDLLRPHVRRPEPVAARPLLVTRMFQRRLFRSHRCD